MEIDPDDVDPAFVEFLDDLGCYGPDGFDLDGAEEDIRECEEGAQNAYGPDLSFR